MSTQWRQEKHAAWHYRTGTERDNQIIEDAKRLSAALSKQDEDAAAALAGRSMLGLVDAIEGALATAPPSVNAAFAELILRLSNKRDLLEFARSVCEAPTHGLARLRYHWLGARSELAYKRAEGFKFVTEKMRLDAVALHAKKPKRKARK